MKNAGVLQVIVILTSFQALLKSMGSRPGSPAADERSEFPWQNCLSLHEGQAVLYMAVRCFGCCDPRIGEPAVYYKVIS